MYNNEIDLIFRRSDFIHFHVASSLKQFGLTKIISRHICGDFNNLKLFAFPYPAASQANKHQQEIQLYGIKLLPIHLSKIKQV